MMRALRSISAAAIAAALMTSATVPSSAIVAGAFDGNWSVIINTLRGDCGSPLRYAVRIVGGHVQGEDPNYQVAGLVSPNGSIRVMVADGGRSANGSGRLAGNSGAGLWRTSTGDCSGQWTAQRRNW